MNLLQSIACCMYTGAEKQSEESATVCVCETRKGKEFDGYEWVCGMTDGEGIKVQKVRVRN